MVVALVTWVLVAVSLIVVILMRVHGEKKGAGRRRSRRRGRHPRFLELGHENEEFFITGDTPATKKNDDYDIYTGE